MIQWVWPERYQALRAGGNTVGTFISFVIIAFAGIFLLAAFANLIRVFFGGEQSEDPLARKEALRYAGIALALAVVVFLCLLGLRLDWRIFP